MFSRREVAGINVEDKILKEVLKLYLLVVGEESYQSCDEGWVEDYSLDEFDDAMMVILEERAELYHFHEVDLLLLDLALETEAVLEGTELLDQLDSFLVVLSHAG